MNCTLSLFISPGGGGGLLNMLQFKLWKFLFDIENVFKNNTVLIIGGEGGGVDSSTMMVRRIMWMVHDNNLHDSWL